MGIFNSLKGKINDAMDQVENNLNTPTSQKSSINRTQKEIAVANQEQADRLCSMLQLVSQEVSMQAQTGSFTKKNIYTEEQLDRLNAVLTKLIALASDKKPYGIVDCTDFLIAIYKHAEDLKSYMQKFYINCVDVATEALKADGQNLSDLRTKKIGNPEAFVENIIQNANLYTNLIEAAEGINKIQITLNKTREEGQKKAEEVKKALAEKEQFCQDAGSEKMAVILESIGVGDFSDNSTNDYAMLNNKIIEKNHSYELVKQTYASNKLELEKANQIYDVCKSALDANTSLLNQVSVDSVNEAYERIYESVRKAQEEFKQLNNLMNDHDARMKALQADPSLVAVHIDNESKADRIANKYAKEQHYKDVAASEKIEIENTENKNEALLAN